MAINILTITACLMINFGCEDYPVGYPADSGKEQPVTFSKLSDRRNGGIPVPQFNIPDSINRSLIIAAYDEEIPQRGMSMIVYDDSTRSSVTKISYYSDLTVKTEPLVKIRHHEFGSKFIPNESYIIREKSVAWRYASSNPESSRDYVRMDNY